MTGLTGYNCRAIPIRPDNPVLRASAFRSAEPGRGAVSTPNSASALPLTTSPHRSGPRWDILALILVMLVCSAIRWRLRAMPLERDEGEYAYMGQLILQGIPPYQLAYNMKLPGTYSAYAVIMAVFGQTDAGIRMGLLIATALTIILVYAVGRRLLGNLGGAAAGISYAILSVGPGVNGFAAHATHFVVLAAMAGLWFLLQGIEEKRTPLVFVAGFSMGLALLMKQPGAAFAIFGGLYLLQSEGWSAQKLRAQLRPLLYYGVGAILPYAMTCVILWRAGVFTRFWFWTVDYASHYGTSFSEARVFFLNNFPQTFHSAIALWIIAGIGLIVLIWTFRGLRCPEFVAGLFLFSLLATSAGLYFRFHYFILMLPALSLLIAIAVTFGAARVNKRGVIALYLVIAIFTLACASALLQQEYFFFRADPVSASRYVYSQDPFPEAAVVGRYIREHSSPADRIAVLGSEPQILFYAGRRSATGYLYSYSFMEQQKYAPQMQREAIAEIEAASPVYIVFVRDWMILPGSDMTFLRWSNQYLKQNYELVGVMWKNDGLQFHSEIDPAPAPQKSEGAMFLFRRRPS